MSITDPIADMLTRIRNASRARKSHVVVPGSRLKISILDILKKEGFIENYSVKRESKKTDIEIRLKYFEKEPVIQELERVSRPGRRYYVQAKDLRPVRNNLGIAIVSTSGGVMSSRKARSMNMGGEVICRVW